MITQPILGMRQQQFFLLFFCGVANGFPGDTCTENCALCILVVFSARFAFFASLEVTLKERVER